MGIVVRVAAAVRSKSKNAPGKDVDGSADGQQRQHQSWRRFNGGPNAQWQALDTSQFHDGKSPESTRLQTWLLLYTPLSKIDQIRGRDPWIWRKVAVNGFHIRFQTSSTDETPETLCFEDILGVYCRNNNEEDLESQVEFAHRHAAYFRRTSLHVSEDGSDIRTLVDQVEQEYIDGMIGLLLPSGNSKTPTRPQTPLLDYPMEETDFMILTSKMGYYRGQPVLLRASCQDERDLCVETLRRVMKFESANYLGPMHWFSKLRRDTRYHYISQTTQMTVATLICLNFLMNIVEAQSGEALISLLDVLDVCFTAIFAAELAINLFATLVKDFFADPWNYFDSIVVTVGMTTLLVPDLPGGSTLKLMRTFRVFRLFKRVPSLKRLVTAIIGVIPGMGNALILIMILDSIFAILCCKFFAKLGEDQLEQFGDFIGSFFTLWQIMTGDDWSVIVREMMPVSGMPAAVAIFFTSYQLLITYTMLNVMICLLVQGFAQAGAADAETANDAPPVESPLRRFNELNTCRLKSLLIDALVCHDLEAFYDMINQVWCSICRFAEVADPESPDTAICYEELVKGMRELPYCPPCIFKWLDWQELVERRELCNSEGLLPREGFFEMINFAVKRFGKKNLQVAMDLSSNGKNDDEWCEEAIRAYIYGLKAKAICMAEASQKNEDQLMNIKRNAELNQYRFQKMRRLVCEFNRMKGKFICTEEAAKEMISAEMSVLTDKLQEPEKAVTGGAQSPAPQLHKTRSEASEAPTTALDLKR